MWPTWPNGSLENWSQISPTYFDLTGPAMESGFISDPTEPGRTGVYRCPASGGDAIALSKDIDGINPQESFDGKTVYFASHHEKSTLKKVTLRAARYGVRRWMDCPE